MRLPDWLRNLARRPLPDGNGSDDLEPLPPAGTRVTVSDVVEPPFGEACPGGSPVPEFERCTGVDCDSIALTELPVGAEGTVSCLADPDHPLAWKLAVMGILPGARLRLVQRYPVFVFRMGYAEFAIDETLAAQVRVRLEEGGKQSVDGLAGTAFRL